MSIHKAKDSLIDTNRFVNIEGPVLIRDARPEGLAVSKSKGGVPQIIGTHRKLYGKH
jgi:hypothetical protein